MLMTTGNAALIAGFSLLGMTVWQSFADKPTTYVMELLQLSYNNGKIIQQIQVNGKNRLPAKWTAEIERDGNPICGGSGANVYSKDSRLKFFSPSDWTGDVCPELKNGDVARAVWEYTTVNGFNASIWGEVIIKK